MPQAAAASIVFVAAAAVLMLEILAARLMAPYVGVSLNTYTGIIGTVLAGIAAGTWLGGRAADRLPPRRLLGPILVAGGVLTLATPPLVIVLGERLDGADLTAIVALSAATVFLPAFVLSAVTPVMVKMQLTDLRATGRVVGRLSGVATVGALVGTYGTGFILAARLPNRTIIACIGAVLIVTGIAVWWRLSQRVGPAVAALIATVTIVTSAAAATVEGPCKVESGYFCIRVISGGPDESRRLLLLDDLTHSSIDLRHPASLTLDYTRVIAAGIDALSPPGTHLKTLHIGGGAFSLPRHLAATRPGSTNTVMELDQAVVDTARADFALHESPNTRIVVGDARLGMKKERVNTYDFAIGDAFASRSVPWHLTTQEFLSELEGVLRPDGAYLMNLIDGELRFVRAEAATMKKVFRHVALFRSQITTNQILVGSNAPIDTAAIASLAAERNSPVLPVTGPALDELIGDARILEDDYAPVDQLLN